MRRRSLLRCPLPLPATQPKVVILAPFHHSLIVGVLRFTGAELAVVRSFCPGRLEAVQHLVENGETDNPHRDALRIEQRVDGDQTVSPGERSEQPCIHLVM